MSIRNHVIIIKSIHWSVIIHPYTAKAHIEGVQRCVLDQIDEKLSKLLTCKFMKFDKILANIRPRVQSVSLKAYTVFIVSPQRDRTHMEGVQRRVLV